jgi:protein TonB
MRLPLILPVLLAACSSPKQDVVFVEARPTQPVLPAQADAGQVFFEFQVDKVVAPLPDNAPPKYPAELRAAGTEGEVLVQFVVDTAGGPEMESFRILRSSHGQFSDAARGFVTAARFTPAEIRGRKVRQLVQQPLNFQLSR